jgi:hypothetical protein
MARGDFAQAQLNGDRFVESSLEHPDQLSAPPLAPTESAAESDILLQLEALARISRDGHSFQPPEQNDLLETETKLRVTTKVDCRHCNCGGIRRRCACVLPLAVGRREYSHSNCGIYSNRATLTRGSGSSGSQCA